jgi:hepatocyte growth factor-regulated tyrosine kinase substrate
MQSSPPGAILREPRIQELYEAVSALKPKLGRTLSTVVGTYGELHKPHLELQYLMLESLVDMHAKLNTVVRYYDKMLEDRLATAYSHATYQEARPPAQSPHAYQYNPPPQSPSSPSHQRLDYFPSRRSTSISDPANSQAPLQAPQASLLTNSIPQNPHGSAPPQSWGYGNYPTPSLSPSAAKNPPSQYYQEPVPYQNETINVPPSHQPVDQQYPQQHRPGYDAQASYPPYADNHGYYQGQSLPKREETSLIDL